jgi:hypothetical protein
MPIASMTNTMLLSHSAKPWIEPIKKNQYRLLLQVTNLIEVLGKTFKDDRDYLERIKTSMAGNAYPIEISFTPPSIQVEQRKIKGGGNVEVKYAGYVSYGNSEATFHNFIDLDTYKFFYRWASLAGALSLKRNGDSLDSIGPNRFFPVPDIGSVNNAYKVNGTISTYHTENTTTGDETQNSRWILQGVFPASVAATNFDHADDGEPFLTSVSFSVDLALPAQPTT